MEEKIKNLCIHFDANLSEALKHMDAIRLKLLIVVKDNKFYSLLSIGDIQRAILNDFDLSTPIYKTLRTRNKIRVAHTKDSKDSIKQIMIKHKTDFMPVIDSENFIQTVFFWEDIIDESEISDVDKIDIPVVIMAGGKGSRLKPLTNIIPKALVPVGEKPIIESIINKFNKFGTKKFYISLNHKKEMIRQYIKDNINEDKKIEFITEDKPLGTGGSLSLMREMINTTFFVTNCDILIDQDYREIYKYHKKNKNDITLVSALMHYSIPYGIIKTGKSGVLNSIEEKPEITYQVNTGMYIMEPHVLNEAPYNQFFHITQIIQQIKQKNGKIGVFPVSQKSWLDIGVWKKYEDSINEFKNWMNF